MSDIKEFKSRISDILKCSSCSTLPKNTVFQCTSGHLICPGCLNELLEVARLKAEEAECPRCHKTVSKRNVCRNVIAELIASELPSPCCYCGCFMSRNSLERHELELCKKRKTECRYKRIGCRWRGSYHELNIHEMNCPKINAPGTEILKSLLEEDHQYHKQKQRYCSIFDLLSIENIFYKDIQLGPHDTSTPNGIPGLYETFPFKAFKNWWRLSSRLIIESSRTLITYQLILDSDCERWPGTVQYVILQGPYGAFRTQPNIVKSFFGENSYIGPEMVIEPCDSSQCTLNNGKVFNFRFIMFLLSKVDYSESL